MQRRSSGIARMGAIVITVLGLASAAQGAAPTTEAPCSPALARAIPARPQTAPTGMAFVTRVAALSGKLRDAVVQRQVLAGNVPTFLRELVPVTFTGHAADGRPLRLTVCVMPDYLAVGTDRDFIRTPLGLPTAARIALRLGFLLPTPKMVDAIYRQARIRLTPRPMPAGPMMTSTDYVLRHNETVDGQLGAALGKDELVAGHQKDVVLTNRLRHAPGKVAIYGWHEPDGKPIQPLSTVHVARYADYSHGIRLVSATAFVNGKPRPLAEVLQDPGLSALISSDGPIPDAEALMASVAK
ncbi:MAG: hypothetical protein KGN33_00635 [Paracoccaceae bacterium]|nr:hypothetical protein [Paracoccaceae bacterium]